VKLIIHDNFDQTNEFLREGYINTDNSSGGNTEVFPYVKATNYPNPFNPATTISYTLPRHISQTNLSIEIFNIKGQMICNIPISKIQDQVSWNGKDNNGYPVSTGVYNYRVNIKDYPLSKMTLIK